MPFVTKKPSYYLKALAETSEETLHIGLFFANSVNEQQSADLIKLGSAIRQSKRIIRCLWLRFRDGDDSISNSLKAFGDEIVGVASIQSLVIEGKAGFVHMQSLTGFFQNNSLRGLQFRRTDIDASASSILKPMLSLSKTLRVLDLSHNSKLSDDFFKAMFLVLSEAESNIETLNICETDIDTVDDDDGIQRISRASVELIARFVGRSTSISSITLHLLNLDDIGIGELANAMKHPGCTVRRLDVGGNFGNDGVKILGEALKTNNSIKTITLGCHENLSDTGAQALLRVVDPFSFPSITPDKEAEWEAVKTSNHTLQSVFILKRPTVTVSNEIVTKLQTISDLQPHQTFQLKAWRHIEQNIEDISHTNIQYKHLPEVLYFAKARGGINGLFGLVRSSISLGVFEKPSAERARLSIQMNKIERENAILKRLLRAERERNKSLRNENSAVRSIVEVTCVEKCPPLISCKKLCLDIVELLKGPIW